MDALPARVAHVGQSLARALWGEDDVVGRSLIVGENAELSVVGVVPAGFAFVADVGSSMVIGDH